MDLTEELDRNYADEMRFMLGELKMRQIIF